MKSILASSYSVASRRQSRRLRALSFRSISTAAIFLASIPVLRAQYQGLQQIGLTGLEAGTQPAQGVYITIPLDYRFNNISLYNAQGRQVLRNLTADLNVIVVPAIAVVTPFKILGANYGASYTQWVSNGVVSVAAINFHRSTGYGFGDLYVQPIILGWHFPRADITTGYSFFAPTGSGSAGLHMWANEIDFGTTLYPDAEKKWNLSTMMYYDLNQPKLDQNVKVGNILTLSGGVGRTFLKGAANAGVTYGAQWKMTHDSGSDIPAILSINNGRVFGVGPEIGVPIFTKGRNLGLVSFRYLRLIGPKTALGGQIFSASFTLARIRQ
jgi:hypothetical protein